MANEWKIEAVKEQFKVLHSLSNLHKDLDTNNVNMVINEVTEIVNKHLRVKDKKVCKPIRHICSEIIKASDGKVKFGFIVIVTDERVNGLLCKLPIFCIQIGQETVFLDVSCFSFKSWNSFLQHCEKMLPHGRYCFPVNGCYLDGRRLKVDFGTKGIIHTKWWKPLLCIGIAVGTFAATFFLNIKPILGIVNRLMPVAQHYLEKFSNLFFIVLTELSRKVADWKEGKISLWELTPIIFNLLRMLYENYKEEIDAMMESIKNRFKDLLEYLKRKFQNFFSHGSFPFKVLALTSSDDESLVRTGDNLRQSNDLGTSHHIFEDCINDSACHYRQGKEKYQDESQFLTPYNKALVCLTSDFVHTHSVSDQQNLAQNQLCFIYESLRDMVYDETKERLKLYYMYLDAACNSGYEIMNINEYNKNLGITGNLEAHCFREAINHINQSPIIQLLVTKKCKELIEQEPVQLIQCLEMQNNKKLGLYKCIGVIKGLIPAKMFVNPLKEIFCTNDGNVFFDEINLVKQEEVKGLSSEIVLLTNGLSIWIWQGLNMENHAEGYLAIF